MNNSSSFIPGRSGNPAGRPKTAPIDLELRRITKELKKHAKPITELIDAAEPVLLALAIERADQDDNVLASVLALMAARRDAANIDHRLRANTQPNDPKITTGEAAR
jgi:hypothetical protein